MAVRELIGPLVDQEQLRRTVWPAAEGSGRDSCMSRTHFYTSLMTDPSFPRVVIGGRVYFPVFEVKAWLAERMTTGASGTEPVSQPKRRRGRPRKNQDEGVQASR